MDYFIIIFFPLNYFLAIVFFHKNISLTKSIVIIFFLLAILFLINRLELKKSRSDKYSLVRRLTSKLSIGLSVTLFGIYLMRLDFSRADIFFVSFIIMISWMFVPILYFRDYFLDQRSNDIFKNIYFDATRITLPLTYIIIVALSIWNLINLLQIEFMGTIIISIYNFLGGFFFYIISFNDISNIRKNISETITDISVLPSKGNSDDMNKIVNKDLIEDVSGKKFADQNGTIIPTIELEKTYNYSIPTYFLGEVNNYFQKAGKSESLCLMGGLFDEKNNSCAVYGISKPIMDIQNAGYAKSDQLSLHMELTKFDNFGHSVLT